MCDTHNEVGRFLWSVLTRSERSVKGWIHSGGGHGREVVWRHSFFGVKLFASEIRVDFKSGNLTLTLVVEMVRMMKGFARFFTNLIWESISPERSERYY